MEAPDEHRRVQPTLSGGPVRAPEAASRCLGAARYPRSVRRWLPAVTLALAFGISTPRAGAQPLPGEVPLTDVLQVMLIDRDVVALDAVGGGQVSERLRLGEEVIWTGSRGRVGVVLTDQRILAAAAVGSAAWQETSYQRAEVPPTTALLGDRVALLFTSVRVIGFDGGSGNLVEARLGLRERVLATRTGENVALMVTDRRALGLSPFTGGFFETRMQLSESIESVQADSNLATITTNRRVLIFRAPTGTWGERNRTLR